MSAIPGMPKEYLGDGAYADFDGYHVVLTTEDGRSIQNRVCLEPEVLHNFEQYVQRLKDFAAAWRAQEEAAVAGTQSPEDSAGEHPQPGGDRGP